MASRFFGGLQTKTTVEQKQVVMMLCTGFFMGVFIATYQITADSMFISRLGHYLDKAFLIAGGLGIITTSVFSFFQNRIKFTIVTQCSVIFILAFSLSAFLLIHNGSQEWRSYYVFALYCMSSPITAILLLSFWGTFGRLFNFRQSKRIIGWIDTGQLIAAIMASFVIPLTSKLVPTTETYLLVCCGSILIVSIFLIIISSSFTLAKNDPHEFGAAVREETKIIRLFKDPYVVLLSVFLLVSMITYVFSQYSFQQLVNQQYPKERDLTNFTAFFTGATYGMSLLMQTFVNSRVISNYGLRISLFILPIVVGVFAFGSLVTGSIFGYSREVSTAGFIYFFLFISLIRMFNWTLRDSLENPVFKLLFIPLENKIRFNVQSKVEGLVNENARFIAGLLIFCFAFIPSFHVIHVSILLMLLCGIYFLVVNNLYSGYRNKIRVKLESSDFQQEKLEKGFTQVTRRLEQMLSTPSAAKAVFSFKLLEKINAAHIPNWINSLMKNDDEVTRFYAQDKMNELKGLSVSDKYVIRMDEKSDGAGKGKNVLSEADLRLIIQTGGDITKARIQKLARSSDPDDRQYAAELLLHTSREEGITFLMELLTDNMPKVRNTAIKTSVKKYNPEVINVLIENLGNPGYNNQAMNTLVLIGTETLTALELAFYRSGQNTQVMLKIVQVMGRIGGQRAREQLWNKIDYPNKVIVSQVLLSLGECGFKAGISQITRIKYAIEADIANIRWNLSAIQEVGSGDFTEQIQDSLRWEIQHDIEHVYMLLAMLYDTRSIQLVKENIDSGTSEGITYAIELLDVFLSEQLKQKVIPVLDDISDSERIGRLENYYPRIKLDSKLLLKFIINRDFTQTNRWTKTCVIHQIGISRIRDFRLDLIAQLFNPDWLIKEISAWSLHQIDPDSYRQNVKRLGEDQKRVLDDIILTAKKKSRFEKILFLQKLKVFDSIPGITLTYLADLAEELHMNTDEWLSLDEKINNNFYILVEGAVDFYQKGEKIAEFVSNQFIGEMIALPNFVNTNLLVARSASVTILKVNKDQFYELLSDNVKLADKILEVIFD